MRGKNTEGSMEKDTIETIPKTMEKFFGCSGKMVKPSPNTVKAIVKKIRKGKLVTIDQLREKLANDFSVQAACPASSLSDFIRLTGETGGSPVYICVHYFVFMVTIFGDVCLFGDLKWHFLSG